MLRVHCARRCVRADCTSSCCTRLTCQPLRSTRRQCNSWRRVSQRGIVYRFLVRRLQNFPVENNKLYLHEKIKYNKIDCTGKQRRMILEERALLYSAGYNLWMKITYNEDELTTIRDNIGHIFVPADQKLQVQT